MRADPHQASQAALAGARRLRRGLALLACLSVLAWTLLGAAHWHDESDIGSRGHSSDCAYCLATPVGAAPPHEFVLHSLPPPRVLASARLAHPSPVSGPLASYRSRAPPVA